MDLTKTLNKVMDASPEIRDFLVELLKVREDIAPMTRTKMKNLLNMIGYESEVMPVLTIDTSEDPRPGMAAYYKHRHTAPAVASIEPEEVNASLTDHLVNVDILTANDAMYLVVKAYEQLSVPAENRPRLKQSEEALFQITHFALIDQHNCNILQQMELHLEIEKERDDPVIAELSRTMKEILQEAGNVHKGTSELMNQIGTDSMRQKLKEASEGPKGKKAMPALLTTETHQGEFDPYIPNKADLRKIIAGEATPITLENAKQLKLERAQTALKRLRVYSARKKR